jgi:FKBP-type peptidyl-prolyl cis-trans isomerase FkpA
VRTIIAVLALSMLVACRGGSDTSELSEGAPMADTGITQLQKQDVKVGEGNEARSGRVVRVHYTGWLYDMKAAEKRGQKFDSSKDSNQPFEFTLGAREVIPGWDEGVAGMKVGGTRILTIPPDMGYGARGVPQAGIPPNATLMFEVELLEVK